MTDPSKRNGSDERRWPWGLAALIVVGAALWACWWIFVFRRFDNWQTAAAFGGSFGGVEALFSGLAFAGIIYTIFLQRKELQYQRLDLEATREELAGQREQMVAQNSTMLQQQFDSTFFQMLRLHHDIVGGMVYPRPSGGRPLEGREVFRAAREYTRDASSIYLGVYSDSLETGARELWDYVYKEFQAFLGHYFRNFYHLIKMVHETPLKIDKPRYTSLARAQLSTDEHLSLFYNAAGRIGRKRFKRLVERYHLLENLHLADISDPRLLTLFRRSAYGDDVDKVDEILQRAGIEWIEVSLPGEIDEETNENDSPSPPFN